MNVEHHKSEVPKRKWPSDGSSSDDSGEDDEDYVVEEEEKEYDVANEEIEEERNERATIICKKKEPRSKGRRVEEEKNDDKERADTFKKKASCSKVGCKRGTVRKRDLHDPFGTNIFRNGHATQPKNPYFIAKIRAERKSQLYVPFDVVRDYKLEFPPSMIIRDSAGREVETKCKSWKVEEYGYMEDGASYACAFVKKNDMCICEFFRGEDNKGLYLQVQFLHEGASSHPSKNNKK